jgi:flagellar hook-length control protein FliK
MNNALLTGLLSDTGKAGFLSFQGNSSVGKEKSNGVAGDFLSLLQNSLSFDTDMSGSEELYQSKQSSTDSINQRSVHKSGFRMENPWERPEVFNRTEQKKEMVGNQKIAETEDEQEKNIQKEADKSGEISEELKALIEENPELQQMLSALSNEEIAALIETFEALDQTALATIEENPQALIDALTTELNKLPDSEMKNVLIEKINSSEFADLLSKLAGITLEVKEASFEKMTAKAMKSDVKASTQAESAFATEVVANIKPDDEKGEIAQQRSESSEKSEKKTDNLKVTQQSSAVKTEDETLREAFSRVNKTDSGESDLPQTVAQENETSTQSDSEPQPGFKFQFTSGENKPAVTQEAARKLVATLLNKTDNGVQSRTASFTYGPTNENGNKTSNFQSNAGNGFSNGFSSNHGTMNSSIAGSRQAATPSNSVFLSQLLEKAEMIKTTDGKKVLSLELDPKELGKMEMELTSKDGTVTAKISAENELAKLKLEELSQQIKEQLNSQGINLTEITVDISSRQPDERNKNQMSDGKNKSNRTESLNATDNEQIISKNILPNLRKVALNIQSVDLTV